MAIAAVSGPLQSRECGGDVGNVLGIYKCLAAAAKTP
jgi:hypothetical protein